MNSFQRAPLGTTFGFQPGFQAISAAQPVADGVGFGPPRPPLAEMMVAQMTKLAREDAERDAAIAAIRRRLAPFRDAPEELWLLGLITDEEWVAA
jgi:hypothetical protein